MKINSLSFERSLFLFTLIVFTVVLIIYAITSLVVVHHSLENSFSERTAASQNLFFDSVNGDLLTGFYSEAYRKCKLFYESGGLSAITITDASGNVVCNLPANQMALSNTNLVQTNVYFDDAHKNVAATIKVYYSDATMQDILKKYFWILILAILLSAAVLAFFTRMMSRYFSTPIQKLSQILASTDLASIANTLTQYRTHFRETDLLYQTIGNMAAKLLDAQQQLLAKTKSEAMVQVATQVAHDIRSPSTAILILAKECPELPEERRITLREAAIRIQDIANNLLGQYRLKDLPTAALPNKATEVLISTAVTSVISEKTIQPAFAQIQFKADISQTAYFAFIKIDLDAFKRVVSNLINNANEAMQQHGTITVSLTADAMNLHIKISDHGKGMPEELIQKIKQSEQVTSGKAEGHGLGLSHAKEVIERYHGQLDIQSELAKGTDILIEFPRLRNPQWMADVIELQEDDTIVILDDDNSIHGAWDQRFKPILHIHNRLQVKHFNQGLEAIKFIQQNKQPIFLLTDYELLKQTVTGLDVIEQTKIKRSILVTSHYTNQDILNRVLALQAKVLPKPLAAEIEIKVSSTPAAFTLPAKKAVDLIFIDDDAALTEAWDYSAYKAGKAIAAYNSVEQFFQEAKNYEFTTPIYIDSELGQGVKGEIVAKTLFERGFQTIYLATGYYKSHFPAMPWIKDVVSKAPPFK